VENAMNTYAIQHVLHYRDSSPEDRRFTAFLEDLRGLAELHRISFDEYQWFRLSGENYKIRPCKQCGPLAVNREDVRDGIDNMLPDYWFYVRRGKVTDNTAVYEMSGSPRMPPKPRFEGNAPTAGFAACFRAPQASRLAHVSSAQ
jgi:hypothetical protein